MSTPAMYLGITFSPFSRATACNEAFALARSSGDAVGVCRGAEVVDVSFQQERGHHYVE